MFFSWNKFFSVVPVQIPEQKFRVKILVKGSETESENKFVNPNPNPKKMSSDPQH
jgi:hypothetical protein